MSERLRLTIPASEIESAAWVQIENVMRIPEVSALAIMPDVHAGYDMPIGGVAMVEEYIVPGFVGYDIGCGMCHINTKASFNEVAPEGMRHTLLEMLSLAIPSGVGGENTLNRRLYEGFCYPFKSASGNGALNKAVAEKEHKQYGTLGSGNHFLEIGINNIGEVGVTVHSGSRKPGHIIASYYMEAAKKYGHKTESGIAMLKVDSVLGQEYMHDMEWAQEYALGNRMTMLGTTLGVLGFDRRIDQLMEKRVNENHNQAIPNPENGTVLHRKGATPAAAGQFGIIPANMRDGVWATVGLGNEYFLESASHGAGRTMSRSKAKKIMNVDELRLEMEGIEAPISEAMLDENPNAYKPIGSVLERQEGVLVNVVDHFKPIIVLKGA